MTQRSVTREVPLLDVRAEVVPSTFNAEKRTVQLTWTTGARVKRGGWFTDPYWEELSLDPKHVRMARLQSGAAPLLDTHSSYDLRSVLGVVENAQLEKKSGSATVRFARSAEGDAAMQLVADGILRNVSVGYRVHKLVKVEGGDDKTPAYRAEDWEPYEISMVPIGADAGAVTRSGGGTMNPCEFIQERDMSDPVPPTNSNPPTIAPPVVAVPAPAVVAPAPQLTEEQRAEAAREGARLERERIEGIRRAAKALNRPETEVVDAIAKGTALEAYRSAAIEAQLKAPPEQGGVIQTERQDPRVMPGEDNREKWLRGASNWLFERAAVTGIVREAAKMKGQTVDLDPGEFRGLRLIDLARQSLERCGVRTAGMLAQDLVGLAFTYRSGNTTSDFPVLLENTLNKTLQGAFTVTPDTWTQFCAVGTVQDFRASNRYLLGTFGSLSTVTESGEFKTKAIPDGEKQSITAGTKGNIISISRKAIVNDDMGAFSSLAGMIGRSAKLSPEVDVYALLAQNAGLGPNMSDGLTMFHANHNNIANAAAIGSAAIDGDRVLMASQKDPSNNEILALTPVIIVLPIGLGGTARQINNGQYDFDQPANKSNNQPNRVGGLFRTIVDTPRITGTRRYLFADPSIAPTIEVAFLDGQQQPFMEMREGWRTDGVEWKVRYDYGVAGVGYRGAVTNAG